MNKNEAAVRIVGIICVTVASVMFYRFAVTRKKESR